MAEKLSKTILDRLNSPTKPIQASSSSPINQVSPSSSSNNSNPPPSGWIYPPAFYQPARLIPGSYQHHGSFIHPPWERYYGDFIDYAYEYPVSSTKPSAAPSIANNAYCGCYDNLHGTISRASSRRTNGKCKHCQKSKQPISAPSSAAQQLNSAESALKKLTTQVVPIDQQQVPKKSKSALFRDYLEFNGINR